MNSRVVVGAVALAGGTIFLGQMSVDAFPGAGKSTLGVDAPAGGGVQNAGQIGPDVITGDLPATRHWATDDDMTAYSLATTSCNMGDADLNWVASTINHPVIAQNLFRLQDGRFEQIGQSWLKHSFCALQQRICGDCNGGGGCQSVLHPLCSDPYSASRNGSQGLLGPKWQVNAHTGIFPYPPHNGEGTAGNFRRRLQVMNDDLEGGDFYFIEGQYTANDDAAWGNQNNNTSYRRVRVGARSQNFPITFVTGFTTRRSEPAIEGWKQFQSSVTLVSVQVDEDGLREGDPGLFEDGRFVVGYDVTDNGDGTWDYEYAVYNQNSHRSGRAMTIPVPSGVTVTSVGFHDVPYHSGDGIDGVNFDGTDWAVTVGADTIRWETSTFENNENANALRWGTVYNFRFTADAPPQPVEATIDLFRPDAGNPDFGAVSVLLEAPSGPGCPEDLDGSGAVDFGDILAILKAWGNAGGPEDLDGSGTVDFGDILAVLSAWGACP